MEKKLLSIKEAVGYSGDTEGLLRAAIAAGELPFHDRRLPGSSRPLYRLDPAEIDRWHRNRHVTMGKAAAAAAIAAAGEPGGKSPPRPPTLVVSAEERELMDQLARRRASRRARQGA